VTAESCLVKSSGMVFFIWSALVSELRKAMV
jgi:hypothetical protein